MKLRIYKQAIITSKLLFFDFEERFIVFKISMDKDRL